MNPHRSAARARQFFEVYTQDLTTSDLERLFTRDAPEAYRFFSRGDRPSAIEQLPWHRRARGSMRLFFLAFTMKLSPARRAIFGVAFVAVADRPLQPVRSACSLSCRIGDRRVPVFATARCRCSSASC